METEVKNMVETAKQHTDIHTVWVGEEDRIASFHAVESYQQQTFASKEYFIDYLRSLQERGYRFQ